MSFNGELAGFARGIRAGSELGSRLIKAQIDKETLRKMKPATDADLAGQPNPYGGGPQVGTSTTDPTKTSSTSAPGSGEIAWKGASPEQRALLLTISSKESPGYNVMYGGSTFDDYSRHPGRDIPITSGPNKGKTSSAAGKYQFLGSTWNDQANKWGLKDFSPENQDIAALHLAEENYGRITGRSLNEDLKSKDPAVLAGIGKALKGTWTSLPGGIEQGQDSDQFVSSFNSFLGSTPSGTGAGAGATTPAAAGSTGVLPEEEDEAAVPADDEDEEEAAYIDPGEISVTPVEKPVIQAPQVAQAFPGEQDPYKLYAAKGGVIPEFDEGGLTQEFNNVNGIAPTGQAVAGEGANNSGIVNPNSNPNPGASFEGGGGDDWNIFHSGTGDTQGLGSGGSQNIFTMEQLNDPTPPPAAPAAPATAAPVTPPPAVVAPVGTPAAAAPAATGKTPSQIAWEKLNEPKPAEAAPAAPAAPKFNNTISADRLRGLYDTYITRTMMNRDGSRDHWQNPHQALNFGNWMKQNYGDYVKIPGTSNYGIAVKAATGGVIPEFAEGGMVSFDELLRQEKGNRDQAAKRFNAQKGGPTSSAYDPDGFWEKKDKFPARPKAPGSAPTPTPRPDKETKTASTKPAKTSPIEEQRKEQRQNRPKPVTAPQISPIEEQRKEQRENRPGSSKPLIPAAGTPTAGYDPKPVVAAQKPGSTAVKPVPGQPLSATEIISNTVSPYLPTPPPNADKLQTGTPLDDAAAFSGLPDAPAATPSPAVGSGNPDDNPALVGEPDPYIKPVIPEDRDTRETSSAPQWQDPHVPVPTAPVQGPPVPQPPRPTPPVVAPGPDPLANIQRPAAASMESGIIPEEADVIADREGDRSVQPLPRPDASAAEPQMPPPPRLVSKGAGAPPELVKRFQDMMAQAPTPQAQQRIAREAVKYGLRFVLDDWGDRYAAPGGMGFAEGGVVPEEDEPAMQSQHQPNYITSPSAEASGNAQQAAPRETVQLHPTEKMRNTLSQAVNTGIDYLNQVFGSRGGAGAEGGVMPEGQSDGPMRMARGEGAATPEEINEIDNQIDPNREMSEADRHMTRVAKSVSWYLEQGRPEDAAAASASLLMYGAGRAQKLGTLAAAAYADGDIERAAKFIEKAYETIPDASGLDIQISADGQGFVMNKTGPDGDTQQIPVSAEQMPALIRGMQDNSLYWQQIQRLADPATFRAKQADQQQDKRDLTKRGYELSDEERERGQELEDAETKRKEAAALAKSQRELKLQDTDAANKEAERRIRLQNELKGSTVPDMEKINPLRGQYTELMKTQPEEMNEEDFDPAEASPETQAWIAQRDQLLSRISDAVPKGQGGKWIGENMGVYDFGYIAAPDGGAAAATAPTPVGEPQGPNKYGKWGQKYSDGTFKEVPAPAG